MRVGRRARRRRAPRIALALAVVTLVAMVAGTLSLPKRKRAPDIARFPIRGIDVSHHQGAIDWRAAAQSGEVRFAYIKATEGGDFVDPRFAENWSRAREAGVVVGAYHFFSLCRDGAVQAANFLHVVAPDDAALPPVADVEIAGNCAARPTRDDFARDLHAFLRAVTEGWRRAPILYLTRDFYDWYLRSASVDADLWVRDTDGEPRAFAGRWRFWQFDDRGAIDGIDGDVDRDVFAGDADAWRAFVAR